LRKRRKEEFLKKFSLSRSRGHASELEKEKKGRITEKVLSALHLQAVEKAGEGEKCLVLKLFSPSLAFITSGVLF